MSAPAEPSAPAAAGSPVEGVTRAPRTRVIAVDGRSGSGKTSLAAELRSRLGAPVVTLEDLYGGWDGLDRGIDLLVSAVLVPVAAGRPAAVPRYDWVTGRWAEPWRLEPPGTLIVEGAGAGAGRAAAYADALIWLELAAPVRRRRALDRDGETYAPHWDRWAAQEEALLDRERTPERAGLVLDGAQDPAAAAARVIRWLGQRIASGPNSMTVRAASVTEPDSDG